MTIYDPVFDGTGIFSGGELGKNAPFYSPIKGYKINLSGGSGGRAQAIVSGAYHVGRYFAKNPRFGARIGAVAGGAVVKYATSRKYGKKVYSAQSVYNRKRRYRKSSNDRSCCCTVRRNTGKRRRYY